MNRPHDGWKLKRDSETYLIVNFKDGNVRTFYSRDWKSQWSKKKDRALGIRELKRLVVKWATKSNIAFIKDRTSGQMIGIYNEGKEINRRNNESNR